MGHIGFPLVAPAVWPSGPLPRIALQGDLYINTCPSVPVLPQASSHCCILTHRTALPRSQHYATQHMWLGVMLAWGRDRGVRGHWESPVEGIQLLWERAGTHEALWERVLGRRARRDYVRASAERRWYRGLLNFIFRELSVHAPHRTDHVVRCRHLVTKQTRLEEPASPRAKAQCAGSVTKSTPAEQYTGGTMWRGVGCSELPPHPFQSTAFPCTHLYRCALCIAL